MTSDNNYKNPCSGCDIYGDQRLKLALTLKEKVFSKFNIDYCIENGTLLGAYRNHKFIPHDDDFDFAVFIKDKSNVNSICDYIKQYLPKQYSCRLVESYCLKIEVYDPNAGLYILSGPKYNGADYHHVTVDLQFHLQCEKGFKQLYYIGSELINKEEDIFPLTLIELEHNIFPAPRNTVDFLKACYGSIRTGAKYNPETCKYEDSI